jgi:hypothetical protein
VKELRNKGKWDDSFSGHTKVQEYEPPKDPHPLLIGLPKHTTKDPITNMELMENSFPIGFHLKFFFFD